MYTASTAFLEALSEAGVSYIFANWGSDHPALLEALAETHISGRTVPEVITCPNEMVALSAAQGYAQVSGRAQAVVVHVECGTQSLAGAIHNAAKGRAPAFIFAGASPFSQSGEMRGSRNEFIQWIQDVHDQRGIVRGYMRYNNEIRTGKNIKQLVHRAMQFAHSDPKGPVYLMGAREVMEEEVSPLSIDMAHWQPLAAGALASGDVETIADDLVKAQRPLAVTSYLGRNPRAAGELVQLCERVGMGVLESVPSAMNFPADNPLYQGNQWNHPHQNPILAEADFLLVLDSDVPWIPTVSKPRDGAVIHHIDIDPLKEQMPLWYIPSRRSYRADSETALRQLNSYLAEVGIDGRAVKKRSGHYRKNHKSRAEHLAALEKQDGVLTGEILTAALRRYIDGSTIVLNEGISHYHTICDHLRLNRPGSIFTSGGGSLGWNGGAAIGAKLASPESTVMALTGDGSFMFAQPSTVHWIARQYRTPFLQVVYNNRGWKSPKLSALAIHPDGYASRANEIGVTFDPPPDYAGIAAAAGGAFAKTIRTLGELEEGLEQAIAAVREQKRCAVLDVWLPHL
jgi:acetolactate synthase I/II/III large subunit